MSNDELRTIVILRDVIEKTKTTLDDLRNEEFSKKVITAIDYLAK
ncbi:hypothetical protein [Domibacillus iocasae]|nr:hypothetical protein [Domibacillus iocasae]